MTMSDLYDFIPASVPPSELPPSDDPLPVAWQATADNTVDRQYASAADKTASEEADKLQTTKGALHALHTHLSASQRVLSELDPIVRDLILDLRAPANELAVARDGLAHLQRRNASLIKQCQMWKRRTEEAKTKAEQFEAKLAELKTTKPEDTVAAGTASHIPVVFTRRSPGDTIRYFSSEIMKHATDNLELAGLAIALRMTAAEIDNIPQGDHAR
ncbi:hypothetical protein [Streptomyces sp. MH60]|uniref:hypothetical protein n=1 Tax=Streptomyces sp. MH60 TaxID=1940758 RepID=UPI000D4CB620|nr:hypothetical protein [Streptomyces sp. MH60]PPS89508.1 hypothetical protein BZZ08_01654 [Streptomyces sp. MH60]